MSGKLGMKRSSASNVIRRQIWRSIRIMRRFSQPDLLRTVPGATGANVKKYLSWLTAHGYVAKVGSFTGGRSGEFQRYALVRDAGPQHPTRCELCGQPNTSLVCKKEKETETEKETNKEAAPCDAHLKSLESLPSDSPPEVTHDAA